jgi:membrane-associated phospholipid phosphatase
LVPAELLLLVIVAGAICVLLLRLLLWAALRIALRSGFGPGHRLRIAMMAGGAFLLAAAAAGAITHNEAIIWFDSAVNELLTPYRAPWLLGIFLWLTGLGAGAALVGMVLTATGFLWAGLRSWLIAPLWTSFSGAEAITWSGKYLIGRTRPGLSADIPDVFSPSFPSAHSSGTIAAIGFIAYLVALDVPDLRRRFEVYFWSAALICLVGFSRIFLGVHFISDVAAGFLVGGAWLILGIIFAESRRTRADDKTN